MSRGTGDSARNDTIQINYIASTQHTKFTHACLTDLLAATQAHQNTNYDNNYKASNVKGHLFFASFSQQSSCI